jgi:hypothetical protein
MTGDASARRKRRILLILAAIALGAISLALGWMALAYVTLD